jgi:hypothetical protein
LRPKRNGGQGAGHRADLSDHIHRSLSPPNRLSRFAAL